MNSNNPFSPPSQGKMNSNASNLNFLTQSKSTRPHTLVNDDEHIRKNINEQLDYVFILIKFIIF